MLRWPLTLAIAVLLVAPASAADQSVTATPSSTFSPDSVEIDLGDKVTWNNGGGFHNVEFDDGSFTQPPQPDSSSWTVERTFDTPGVYRYQCGFHGAAMPGVVRVRDATGTVPEPVEVEPGLTLRAPAEQRLRRLVGRRGLRARARCVNGCDIRLRLSLAPRVAKRLGFRRRRTTIGRETAKLPLDRTVALDIGLRRKARRKLAGAERRFKVRLDARAEQDTTETARRSITIAP